MSYLFSTLIVASLLLGTGCDSKPQRGSDANSSKTDPEKPTQKIKHTFTITDIDNRSTTMTFHGNGLTVAKVTQPIIAINIFADWSPPCRGFIPYLNDLQGQYSKELFMIGIPVHSDLDDAHLRHFMKQYKATYFISKSPDNTQLASRLVRQLGLAKDHPVPLTILFKDGKYILHYEGATPIEMMRSDIDQLIDNH